MNANLKARLNVDLKTIANAIMRKKPDMKSLEEAIRNGETNKAVTMLAFIGTKELEKNLKDGNTVLTLAAQIGNKRVARVLVKKGADVNAQNTDGNTVLHYAAMNQGSWGIAFVQKIISKGALVDIKNNDKEPKTPLDYAASNPHFGTLKEILSAAKYDQMKNKAVAERKAIAQLVSLSNATCKL